MLLRRAAPLLFVMLASISLVRADDGGRDGECLAPAAIDRALREGDAARFAEVVRGLDGDVVQARLCRGERGLVYRVVVVDRNGRVRRLVLDASNGRLVYDGR
ncbi:MAG: hypothetical protein LWW93_01990 [Hyphomicrobiales bacterium]|nr:hypothetical protein [Hyphomicrobiales bacterium]